ncbi:hypothetical protein JE024_19255 [Streptomyces zhihengii]|uniref:Integral membrane protein n=1 Tax=Streptomyces zhihengii TaxID=1818004 RepID=A0ABS2UU64_9ACTN|nr:hypothetical protein [Streptomyces zhihengii]
MWRQFRDGEWPTLRELLSHLGRVHGCLWVPLLFCFLGPVLTVMASYPVIRSARHRARLSFPPHRGHGPDASVLRVQTIRAWLAVGASLAILAVFGTSEDWNEAQQQYYLRLIATPWLLLLTAPVVMALLFRKATPARRTEMRARLRPVLRSALRFFGAFTAFVVLAGLLVLVFQETISGDGSGGSPDAVLVVAGLVTYVAVVWLGFFLWFASGTVVRTAFGTADVHPALPALLTGVLVWELSLISFVVSDLPPGPLAVQLLAVLGGPLSVTAVAWWEIGRLRRAR